MKKLLLLSILCLSLSGCIPLMVASGLATVGSSYIKYKSVQEKQREVDELKKEIKEGLWDGK